MSVAQTATRIAKTAGNGVTTAFDFAFKIFAATDLTCFKISAAGVYTLGVLNVDYTVAFNTDAETGTVTWTVAPVTNGFSVIIGDVIPQTQATAFPREGITPAASIKNAYDKLTLLVQQLTERVSRAALQPLTPVNPTAIDIDVPVNAKGLKWVFTGGRWHIASTTADIDTAVSAAAASAAAAAASATAAAASATSAAASATSAGVSAASALATLALFQKEGTFAALDATAGTSFFFAKVTDLNAIMVYLGDRTLGNNGWTTIGGY